MTNDIDHLFICLLAMSVFSEVSSLVKCLLKSYVHFIVAVFVVLLLRFKYILSFLYILDTSLLFIHLLLLLFFAALCGMQHLNSPTGDQTRAPCIGSAES